MRHALVADNKMFDKLKFNNLVITNKKLIQKGRVQTIAKLVNKLRKLKDAKEKQPEEKKHQERLRRNVECMTELKALKHIDIMRALLLQQDGKNYSAVLTNGRATPDERAIAMLGLSKILQTLVAAFRQGLNLSDAASAGWRDEMLQTSKRRLKLERTEEKRRKRKELKAQKAQTRNRLEWLEEHKPDADTSPELVANAIETVAGICTVENAATTKPTDKAAKDKSANKLKRKDKLVTEQATKLRKTDVKQQRHKEKAGKAETQLMTNKDAKEGVDEEQTQSFELKQKGQKPKQAQKLEEQRQQGKNLREPGQIQPKLNLKVQKHKKEEQTNQHELKRKVQKPITEEQTQSNLTYKIQKPKKVEKQRPTHVVDPFFITESGQPYLSSAVVLSGDSHNESEDEEHYVEQRKRKPLAKKPEYNNSYSSYNNNSSNNYNNKNYNSNNSNNNNNNNKNYNSNNSNNNNNNNNPRSNDRHPSWLAKEQQKPIIANFKGKKTKFSDDGKIAATITAAPATVVAAPKAADDSEAGMHPSWLAKQKMKPKIAAFAGTKIKFDD